MTTPKALKNHFLMATIVFSCLFLLMIIFFIIPALRQIKQINDEIFQERKRLENLYARGQLQKKVIGRYNQAKEKSQFLEEIFLTEGQELQYISTLEQAAAQTGIQLKITVGTADPVAIDNVSQLSFIFEVEGQWPNLLGWLQKVEELPYYTNFSDATAMSQFAQNSTSTITALKLNAETYWLRP